jgi:hypothetical protein
VPHDNCIASKGTVVIGPPLAELSGRYRVMFLEDRIIALENEIARLRFALGYYAKPRAYGTGEHSVFIDDSGVAKAALRRNEPSS